jgi:cytochrome b5
MLAQPGDPSPKNSAPAASSSGGKADSTSFGTGLYAVVLVGGLAAYFGYQYLQNQA